MDEHRGDPGGGKWITTWASDVRVGDKVCLNGVELFVLSRDEPPSTQPTFRLNGVAVDKITPIQIWDADGTVAERVASISAEQAAIVRNSS